MNQLDDPKKINPFNLKQVQEAWDAIRHLGLVKLRDWVGKVGISSTIVWRWRKRGWLKMVNIGGLEYLTYEDLADFRRRAKSGDFALAFKKKTKNLKRRFTNHLTFAES